MKTEKDGHGKIPVYEPELTAQEKKYILEALETGWVSSIGPFVEQLEKNFSEYVETKYATSTSSGTTALHLAIESLGIGPKDEVIVPDLTFAATANAVIHANAKPVLADIDKETLNISPEQIEKKITKSTKAIIPVHLYGKPAPMKEIMEIAKNHGLLVIEDAAEAHGASIGNKKVGSFGDASIFSMYANKIVTTGEGGMLLTNNEEIYEKACLLKNHGMSPTKKYWHEVVGYNYRLTNIQAALGLAQIERIEETISRKIALANRYEKALSEKFTVPSTEKGTRNVHWLYWIISEYSKPEQLSEKLSMNGIDSRPIFYPLSSMPPFKAQGFSNSLWAHKNGLCLPSYPTLSGEDQDRIISALLD